MQEFDNKFTLIYSLPINEQKIQPFEVKHMSCMKTIEPNYMIFCISSDIFVENIDHILSIKINF